MTRRRRWLRAGVLALATSLALGACGAPTQQYVAADGYGMYFALPVAWMPVPERQLTTVQSGWTDDAGNVFRQTVLWQAAWTAGHANASQVLAASAPQRPVVYAFVRRLIDVERQGIGSDIPSALQDLVIPSTSLLDDGGDVRTQSVTSNGFRGIHQFATYAAGGVMQSVEVVSVLSPGDQRVLTLVARCSERCYNDHGAALNDIFDSLTFKETRGQ